MSQILSPIGLNVPEGSSTPEINNKENNSNDKELINDDQVAKFSCPHCDHKFTRKHNLKSHLLIHTREKPFSCSICSSKFRRLHDLKRHEKLHTGEKPYQCKNCGRKFARCDALVRHNNSQSGCTLLVDDAILKSRLEEHDQAPPPPQQQQQPVQPPQISKTYETNQWKPTPTLPSINRLTTPIEEVEVENDQIKNYDLLPYVKILESRVSTLETKLATTETKLAQLTYKVYNQYNDE